MEKTTIAENLVKIVPTTKDGKLTQVADVDILQRSIVSEACTSTANSNLYKEITADEAATYIKEQETAVNKQREAEEEKHKYVATD